MEWNYVPLVGLVSVFVFFVFLDWAMVEIEERTGFPAGATFLLGIFLVLGVALGFTTPA